MKLRRWKASQGRNEKDKVKKIRSNRREEKNKESDNEYDWRNEKEHWIMIYKKKSGCRSK